LLGGWVPLVESEDKQLMFHVKHTFVGLTVFACLLVSTTFVQAQNSLSIGSELDLPGGTASATLDVTMESDVERHAVSLAIAYDQTMVSLSGVDVTGTAANNADWSEGTICNSIGGSCTAEGGVLWSIIMGLNSIAESFDTGAAIPAGTNVVAQLDFNTSAMGESDSTNVDFQDGLDLFGVPGKNTIVREGTGVSAPSLVLSGGTISIADPQGGCCTDGACSEATEADCLAGGGSYQGNGTTCAGVDCTPPPGIFRRCDHDGSGPVDITDFVNLLTHLFLGGFDPICQDASDCDNSGAIDISDGVNGLTFLFLGTVAIPPPGPGPACGSDPEAIVGAGGGLPDQPAVTLGCDLYPSATGTACP
jgi:hypothetical protein